MARAIPLAVLALAALIPAAAAETITVDLDGQDVDITYEATDAEVLDAYFSGPSILFVVAPSGSQGSLVVTLERSVIDTFKVAGEDSPYIVLLEAFAIDTFEESNTTPTSRTLRIPLEFDTEEIEIVGDIVGRSAAPAVSVTEEPVDDVPVDDAMMADVPEDTTAELPDDVAPAPPEDATSDVSEEPAMETGQMEDGAMMEQTEDAMMMEDDAMMQTEDGMMEQMEGEMMEPDAMDDTMMRDSSPVCGQGTVLAADGTTCVLSAMPSSQPVSYRDLVFGAGAGFVISIILVIIMVGIGRAARP